MGRLGALTYLVWIACLCAPARAQDEPGAPALAELQPSINSAIDRGVAYLLGTQLLDGSWPDHQSGYRNGATSLCAYALVKSGLSPEHPSLRRALAYVEANPPRKTYEVGCNLLLLLALEPEQPSDAARAMLDDLLRWQHGDFGYGPGSGADLSNTQYAALALWAAARMGLEVPGEAWKELALRTLDYRVGGDEQPVSGARGFSYRPGQERATGSMTTGGVSILAICMPYLSGRARTQSERALLDGLGWLEANFVPHTNPGSGGHHLYYLYGVERVGALTERAHFGEHDWYLEGARELVEGQQPDGSWERGEIRNVHTSFALLFLNRATAPVSAAGGNANLRTYGTDDPDVAVNVRASGDTPITLWISSFGDEVHEQWTFEEDGERGPRVLSVEYLTDGGVLLPRSDEGGSECLWLVHEPASGWNEVEFETRGWRKGRTGIGSLEDPTVVASTEWESDSIWLRQEFELDREALVEPRLEVYCSSSRAPLTSAPAVELLKLYDEEEGFAQLLSRGPQDSSVRQVSDGARRPQHSLHVQGTRRENTRIPGWSFPIREDPALGEFRYLHLRWRTEGAGVMVELPFEGHWDRPLRYYAGELGIENLREESIQVEKRAPKRWEEVVFDLWEDRGRDSVLSGLALTPMQGEAWFDQVYLGRDDGDFRRIRNARDEPLLWGPDAGAPEPEEHEILELWLNGQLLCATRTETRGYEVLAGPDALLPLLREGRNMLALHARNGGAGRTIDVSLRDRRLLARVPGDASAPAGYERFAARARFQRPGRVAVRARVRLAQEGSNEPVVLESPDLSIDIVEAGAECLLEYAGDAARNLITGSGARASASSHLLRLEPRLAVDGSLATAWICYPGDQLPRYELQFGRALRADTLLLTAPRQAPGGVPRFGRPRRMELYVNGSDEAIPFAVDSDPMTKTVVGLGRAERVRSLELRVIDWPRTQDGQWTATGLAEVELQLIRQR